MTRTWNYDKPHRCPECHTIWTYADKYNNLLPRWWRTYDCFHCGAVFSGRWAWAERWRDWLRMQNSRRKWVNRDRKKDL